MPQTSPPPARTKQVERIREILVGRQMESVERRLETLEKRLATDSGAHDLGPMPVAADPGIFETRLAETRREGAQALALFRDEIDADRLRQMEETQRLARQIQTVARGREDALKQAREALESDLREWFGDWQTGLQRHLRERENFLITELRRELDRLRSQIEAPAAGPDLAPLAGALKQLGEAATSIAARLQPPSSPQA